MTLIEMARAARDEAYAPYSGFKVGAALRASSGQIYVGVNVENSAYPEGTCAEAGAIASMIASGDRVIDAICVIADSPSPVPPCGGCRQKIAEFSTSDTVIIMATLDGVEEKKLISALLPGAFGKAHLIQNS